MKKGLTASGHLKGAAYRHCFVSFPHSWRMLIAPAAIPTFRVESNTRSLIVSWMGYTHDPEENGNIIYISSKLLWINDFSEGETVIVRQVPCPSACTNVCMSTVSDSDWEGLLLNTETASEAILSQFRVVVREQIFPLWLEGGAVIYLKVCKLSTSSFVGLLHSNTQVEVLPPSQTSSQHPPMTINPSKNEIEENSKVLCKSKFFNILYILFFLFGNINKKIAVLPKQNAFLGLKVIPYFVPANHEKNFFFDLIAWHPAVVVISKKHLLAVRFNASSYFIGTVFKIESKKCNDTSPLPFQGLLDKVMVTVVIWEKLKETLDIEAPFVTEVDVLLNHKTCILSRCLTDRLSLGMESIITLETSQSLETSKNFAIDVTVTDNLHKAKNIIYSTLLSQLTDLCKICPIVLNNFCIMNLDIESSKTDIIIKTKDNKPFLLDKNSVAVLSINIEMGSNQFFQGKSIAENVYKKNKQRSPKILVYENVLVSLVELIKRDLKLDLNPPTLCPQFILVQGSKGSGKTTLMESLVEQLAESPFFVHCETIHLKLLKGKKVDSVQKILKMAIKKAQNFQPSLIILDDIDFLAPTQSPAEEEKGALFEYVYYMAFMIRSLLTDLLESMRSAKDSRDFITVVATCCLRSRVHCFLSMPEGNHIFPKSIYIQSLNGESKLRVLQALLKDMRKRYLVGNMTLAPTEEADELIFCYSKNEIMFKLEGLALPDISKLAQRIYLQSKARWKLKNDQYSGNCYLIEDVMDALSGFVSLSCKGLKPPIMSKPLRKIGGLRKAREAINEMILWPSQYPHLFSQTKLRLRSGLLLYGPPGCGKTLLAQSLQGIPQLNFIVIKGPELLSKYIGQSEKSVRNAFERAHSAKPCVLFFDEFESIAPRRGHDNTGVTDRVVNQLLTQLDGVEDLAGVYVVAATSRPELIDPALLRPGRLDKGIYCPIPDESEREEILSIFIDKLNIEETLDLNDLAKRTDGFTGADLQSLLATAQVKAAEMIRMTLYEVALDERRSTDSSNEGERLSVEEFITVSLDQGNGIETTAGLGEISTVLSRSDFPTAVAPDERLVSVPLKKQHIEKALGEVRPSVSDMERSKFEALHKMFSSDDENKMFAIVKAGKKETLA